MKFIGTIDPNLEMAKLKRAVNSQKCIRAGGKHNDLDDVGKDVYHHTFFEMLGNWYVYVTVYLRRFHLINRHISYSLILFITNRSFGDYFKEEAITMAWQCLTEEFKLDPSRLYATYFRGDQSTPCDEEARDIWLRYLPPDHVLPYGAKENFWEMGATGPCGPCTEIHYDRIGNRDAAHLVNADVPDVIEIWNNVFMQFNREADGSLRPLPAQHVDTGMGFERLSSILQGKDSNYDTDIFMPIFDRISEVTGARPYAGKVGADDIGFIDMAYRVVADHIRTLTFAISDGAVPSNDGRGYVLRRILRRAVRYGRQNLGAELGFFAKLVPTIVELMGHVFPEIVRQERHVIAVIKDEEESFSRTLDKGLLKFKELAEKVGSDKMFSGIDAHFLYTSMGFPVDLTTLMAEELGLKLDKAGFEMKMKEEQDLSAAAHQAKMSGSAGKDMRIVAEQIAYLVNSAVPATDDSSKYVWNEQLIGCTVKALFVGRGETEDGIGFVDTVSTANGAVGIILTKSSFYAEAGGQIYDTGSITSDSGAVFNVQNVQSYGQYVLHIGVVSGGSFSLGDSVTCSVDYVRRAPIAANHTMTHVLNFALKDVLITKNLNKSDFTQSIDQKGSQVDENKLRFDFSWNGSITEQQLDDIEKEVNRTIDSAINVEASVAPLEDAKKIISLRAVFGEVYPDPVRVIAVSPVPIQTILENPQDATWSGLSVEFCGGTHLKNSKEAGAFVLLQEEGIAKGIRRITGITMDAARNAQKSAELFQAKVLAIGNGKESDLEEQVKQLTNELNELSISASVKIRMREVLNSYSKRVVAWKKEQASAQSDAVITQVLAVAASIDGNRVICRIDFGIDMKLAKLVQTSVSKVLKDKCVMILSADIDVDRFMLIAFAPKGIDIDCKDWVLSSLSGLDAKGGGKIDSAQYTVDGISSITSVMDKAKSF